MKKDQQVTRKEVENIVKKEIGIFRKEIRDLIADTAKVIVEFVRAEATKTKGEIDRTRREFEEFVKRENRETHAHFDAVAENIHHDLAGANHDEISTLETKQEDHEERITALERRSSLR